MSFWLLLVAALLLAGCPEEPPDSDAGHDGGADGSPPAIEVELGGRQDGSFVKVTEEEPTLEVVSGFQGGYHIEPGLRMETIGAEEFISVVEYRVTDAETGELLSSDPMSYRINQRAWNYEPGVGHFRVWEQVILNVIDPDDAAGRLVDIDVRVFVEGGLGEGTDAMTVRLINEVNELR